MTEEAEREEPVEDENTDDCLTVEGMQDFLLEELRSNRTGMACNRVRDFLFSGKTPKKLRRAGR